MVMKHSDTYTKRSTAVRRMASRLLAVLLLAGSTQSVWADIRKVSSGQDLAAALRGAQAGDAVLVQAGVYRGAFTVQAGVRLYGGFSASELSSVTTEETLASALQARATLGEAWKMTHQTVLDGDVQDNDVISLPTDMFGGTTRTDNAQHVLTVSGGTQQQPTVIDGFTIRGGSAWNEADDPSLGGGLYAADGDYVTVNRCFFYNNSARSMGGGLYTASGVRATVGNSVFFDNAAGPGQRQGSLGGGLYVADGLVYNCAVYNNMNGGIRLGTDGMVLGCTVANNTMMGVGADSRLNASNGGVFNTVMWGNTQAFDAANISPAHCGWNNTDRNASDQEGNLLISNDNGAGSNAPQFEYPTTLVQYMTFAPTDAEPYPQWSWRLMRTSALIGAGSVTHIPDNLDLTTDLAGLNRFSGSGDARITDIGAYQYQAAQLIVRVDNTVAVAGNGDTWTTAMKDLQAAINYVHERGGGEVWVRGNGADHPYRPTNLLHSDVLSANYTSFIMYDGVSVYGGFAGTETSLKERDAHWAEKGNTFPKNTDAHVPWSVPEDCETVLEGSVSSTSKIFSLNAADRNNPVMSSTAVSYHVVWFAPRPGDAFTGLTEGFHTQTVLDGVTIKHGNATPATAAKGHEQRGGGVYMGPNAVLSHCVVTECMAADAGGAVYMDGGGQVISCMIHRNGVENDRADMTARGGGVYIRHQGIVTRSMISNNLAAEGAGVFMKKDDAGQVPANYLILATNVISNNTARVNGGAVYMDGGVVQQSTVTLNYCTAARTLVRDGVYNGETGGVYIKENGVIVNSVLWANQRNSNNSEHRNFFALNPASGTVRVWNTALDGRTLVSWNGIDQQSIVGLSSHNTQTGQGLEDTYYPNFWDNAAGNLMPDEAGVYDEVPDESGIPRNEYYWEVADGSSFNNRGVARADYPQEVLVNAQIDLSGDAYPVIPDLGAYVARTAVLKMTQVTRDGKTVNVIFVDPNSLDATADGSSWAKATAMLNQAISTLAEAYDPDSGQAYEVWVKEGDITPSTFALNADRRTTTVNMATGVSLRGGFPESAADGGDYGWSLRNPSLYHSVLDGNIGDADRLDDDLYHVVTYKAGVTDATLDGFHVVNGYAGGDATVHEGGGLLAGDGAQVDIVNCIFENNVGVGGNGTVIYAQNAASLALTNTVMNNNGHLSEGLPDGHDPAASLITAPTGGTTTVRFCTFANNHVADIFNTAQQGNVSVSSTLAVRSGNLPSAGTGNNLVEADFAEADMNKVFENPTRNRDVNVGYNNYKGGFTSFRPIDRMNTSLPIVNAGGSKGSVETDLSLAGRDLGGVPDIGAYEADLPEAGRIIYVRVNGNGDGLSWGTAMGDINQAVQKALEYNNTLSATDKRDADKRAQVWVAAGTYKDDPEYGLPACFIIEEGVNVYGAFPANGNPGMDERKPLNENYQTILEPLNVSIGVSSINSGDRSTAADIHSQNSYIRRVLAQDNKYNPKRFPYADVRCRHHGGRVGGDAVFLFRRHHQRPAGIGAGEEPGHFHHSGYPVPQVSGGYPGRRGAALRVQ